MIVVVRCIKTGQIIDDFSDVIAIVKVKGEYSVVTTEREYRYSERLYKIEINVLAGLEETDNV